MKTSMPAGEIYVEPTAFGNWIRSPGVRETVESIIIAVLLALLFRFFEAEAYVIPTGSMAPDLQGQHIDVVCPECSYDYRTGASGDRADVRRVVCPICQHPQTLNARSKRDHRPFSGDRILVNKFAYDFNEPERWDVIVFKYPNNGKQNFIKRLIGLPNEGLLIETGDIFSFDLENETFKDRKICRKPPRKLYNMLQMVDDTDHISSTLKLVGWPAKWQQWDQSGNGWRVSEDQNQFSLDNSTDQTQWLRYRHLRPLKKEWESHLALSTPELPKRIRDNSLAGALITDYYAYNDLTLRSTDQFPGNVGMHWVGDLAVDTEFEIKSGDGPLVLELVEGRVRYQCKLDISTGTATFQAVVPESDDFEGEVSFSGDQSCETSVKGAGKFRVRFANADDKLFLWVNEKYVGGCEYSRSGPVLPWWSKEDPGDAEPVGIGGNNIDVEVSRIQVLRDIYYTSKHGTREKGLPLAQRLDMEYTVPTSYFNVHELLRTPEKWNEDSSVAIFNSRMRDQSYVFELQENQLLPMGDNSPQSNDGRVWNGARYIDASYLLGEALYIYWPHAKTSPLPVWPNFGRMQLIR